MEDASGSCSLNPGSDGRKFRLHNFSFPSLSWGSQRLLRCLKIDSDGGSREEKGSGWDLGEEERGSGSGLRQDEEDLVRFKDQMMAEFQKALGNIPVSSSLEAAEGSRPWNLRLRRAACNAPAAIAISGSQKGKKSNQIKHRSAVFPQEIGAGAGATTSGRGIISEGKKERSKFSQTLSKNEIVGDFLAMTGSKPPRRLKKRPRSIQKQIEMIYPGLYLCEISPELYRTSQEK